MIGGLSLYGKFKEARILFILHDFISRSEKTQLDKRHAGSRPTMTSSSAVESKNQAFRWELRSDRVDSDVAVFDAAA